jgi:quinol monooxygenase YgiN
MLRVRRIIISALSAIPLIACQSVIRSNQEPRPMYGLIGKMRSVPGQRDALASILIQGTSAMPGCLSYIVAIDGSESDALWVTEVWDSSASHRASLSLPAVQQAITKAKPLIAGFGERFETTPIGGYGLAT